jgi:hypothetical protein
LGTYSQGGEASLSISKATPQELVFELESANIYRGSTCSAGGKALLQKDAAWLYKDTDAEKCEIRLSLKIDGSMEVVSTPECNGLCGMGASIGEGNFAMRPKECENTDQIGTLSKAKKYKEAFEAAKKVENLCRRWMEDNSLGSLYSDLAFLSFQLGDKKACLEYVKKGVGSMHLASEGLPALQEALDFYLPNESESDEPRSCKDAWKPGCWIYEERIKIFKWLQHNEELCKK